MIMISTIDDLIAYSMREAHALPKVASEILLRRPGLSEARIRELRSVHPLPPIYTRCIRDLDLFGISIGYFALWPGSRRRADLIDAISEENRSSDPVTQHAQNSKLVVVGREEANLIAVGAQDSSRPDAVIRLDATTSPVVQATEIATDFEKFMLLGANVQELSMSDGDKAAGVQEMERRCRVLGCSDEQVAFWKRQAAMLIG